MEKIKIILHTKDDSEKSNKDKEYFIVQWTAVSSSTKPYTTSATVLYSFSPVAGVAGIQPLYFLQVIRGNQKEWSEVCGGEPHLCIFSNMKTRQSGKGRLISPFN